MDDQENERVKTFYIIYAIIFAINLGGVFYGAYQDQKYEVAKQIIQANKEAAYTSDPVDNISADCKYARESLTEALIAFAGQSLMGLIISLLLIFPTIFYKTAEENVLNCIIPDLLDQWLIWILIIGMALYNLISPVSDMINCANYIFDVSNIIKGIASNSRIYSFGI